MSARPAKKIYADLMLAAVNIGIGLGVLLKYATAHWISEDLRQKFPPPKPPTIDQLRETVRWHDRHEALNELADERVAAKKAAESIDPEGQHL